MMKDVMESTYMINKPEDEEDEKIEEEIKVPDRPASSQHSNNPSAANA